MDTKVLDYIKELGLDIYNWNSPESDKDAYLVLMIVSNDDKFSLLAERYCGGYFMDADDLSWSGPVRNVVAWCEIKGV